MKNSHSLSVKRDLGLKKRHFVRFRGTKQIECGNAQAQRNTHTDTIKCILQVVEQFEIYPVKIFIYNYCMAAFVMYTALFRISPQEQHHHHHHHPANKQTMAHETVTWNVQQQIVCRVNFVLSTNATKCIEKTQHRATRDDREKTQREKSGQRVVNISFIPDMPKEHNNNRNYSFSFILHIALISSSSFKRCLLACFICSYLL